MSVLCYANFWSLKCFERYMSCWFICIEQKHWHEEIYIKISFTASVIFVSCSPCIRKEINLSSQVNYVISCRKKSNKQSQAHRWWTKTDAKMVLIYPFESIIQGGTAIWYYQLDVAFARICLSAVSWFKSEAPSLPLNCPKYPYRIRSAKGGMNDGRWSLSCFIQLYNASLTTNRLGVPHSNRLPSNAVNPTYHGWSRACYSNRQKGHNSCVSITP